MEMAVVTGKECEWATQNMLKHVLGTREERSWFDLALHLGYEAIRLNNDALTAPSEKD